MKKCILASFLFLCFSLLNGQIKIGYPQEDYTIHIEESHEITPPLSFRNDAFLQMEGFPIRAIANKNFKNQRNVTLADLDGDGHEDILWGADRVLYVHTYQGVLWEKQLSSTIIYPPSVADLDQNGSLEIVQTTGGSTSNSSIYLLNFKGQDQTGWPLSFDGHWIITAAALSDLDDDGNLEIIFSERDNPINRLHAVQIDGTPISKNWPVPVLGNLAITPSIGDVNGDGHKEIYTASTTTRYLFDLSGEWLPGWPQETAPNQRYSFQSTVLMDLNGDDKLEIIGAAHGDSAQYFIIQSDGTPLPGWPKFTPNSNWTFNTPTLVNIDESPFIFMSHQIGEAANEMLYGWDQEGNLIGDFPIVKQGGLNGIISVADIDNDNEFELIFGSNQLWPDGHGLIHAFELDGTTEVPGFPIRPRGWTLMNGVNIGDINGDDRMDLVVLSYTQDPNPNATDSVYLNVYELQAPYSEEKVLWNTYKGDNTRDGLVIKSNQTTSTSTTTMNRFNLQVFPNPVQNELQVNCSIKTSGTLRIEAFDTYGKKVKTVFKGFVGPGVQQWQFNVKEVPPGLITLGIWFDDTFSHAVKFIKQ